MSGFDLTIEFGGMCLFVPHGDQVEVVMPYVKHFDHEPRMYVDRRYFVDQSQITEAKLEKVSDDLYGIPLAGKKVNFAVKNQKADATSLKGKKMVSLSRHLEASQHPGGNKVLKSFYAGEPTGNLRSRITLGAGSMLKTRVSGPWTLGGVEGRELAISGEWKIEGIAKFPPIRVNNITLELAPPGEESSMTVHIFNTLSDDNPTSDYGSAEPCEAADHFRWFYGAFGMVLTEVKLRDVPHYICPPATVDSKQEGAHHGHGAHNADGDTMNGRVSASAHPQTFDGRRITCLMAEGEPEP